MDTKGGRISLTINGQIYSGRGKATYKPSTIMRRSGANQDGTGWTAIDPKLASLEITFDRGKSFRWDEDMILEEVNVTLVETDLRPVVTHFWTNGNWEGDPTVNTESGEVTGLSIVGANYRRV